MVHLLASQRRSEEINTVCTLIQRLLVGDGGAHGYSAFILSFSSFLVLRQAGFEPWALGRRKIDLRQIESMISTGRVDREHSNGSSHKQKKKHTRTHTDTERERERENVVYRYIPFLSFVFNTWWNRAETRKKERDTHTHTPGGHGFNPYIRQVVSSELRNMCGGVI